ncbi:hypothetical protein DICVIV_09401 [Dictyocaulus viviparus]|uniref:Uncharacterized protein n=1 Tax=Dictyocaulus viviparus TaxID=29172 RepID=A0A0D8XQD1_DICVI|nr:hypothetical protein DICVIV_09401 [Dictyocaulus viviparus]
MTLKATRSYLTLFVSNYCICSIYDRHQITTHKCLLPKVMYIKYHIKSQSLAYSKNNNEKDVKSQRVAIIGAGFAGLSAAAIFERNSVDYIVYEGANRVGGRVYSISYEDGCLQHGAEFINGENNAIFRIANEKNLTEQYIRDFDLFCRNVLYGFNGKRLDK